ncbi:MAG: twin-arginine translocase TatA/TatE family subunit [Acidimicrobiales bacterium]
MHASMLAIFDSPADIGIVVLVLLLLFGGTQLPKLARSLGSAQREFRKGIEDGGGDKGDKGDKEGDPASDGAAKTKESPSSSTG